MEKLPSPNAMDDFGDTPTEKVPVARVPADASSAFPQNVEATSAASSDAPTISSDAPTDANYAQPLGQAPIEQRAGYNQPPLPPIYSENDSYGPVPAPPPPYPGYQPFDAYYPQQVPTPAPAKAVRGIARPLPTWAFILGLFVIVGALITVFITGSDWADGDLRVSFSAAGLALVLLIVLGVRSLVGMAARKIN
ncbi:hypothetical protein KDK_28260 [Dictyobacter kobayashii]|uniref:Uncharacterized protein n=1 Tax=Dictyobacter kobayashii TaxID=2014872 RepID=A0A402AIV2_9CHLR|nr:hypothetical protein KDK_28260 [Dictyobacter kobayashii]